MVNKKGWIRIVEASIAILIIFTVLLFISGSKKQVTENDLSGFAGQLLEELGSRTDLREAIVSYNLRDENDQNNAETINKIRHMINSRISNSYNYSVRICDPNDVCGLDNFPLNTEGNIYARERIISSTLTSNFEPKKLKIFLWIKRA